MLAALLLSTKGKRFLYRQADEAPHALSDWHGHSSAGA
jgi:hypothetical protein